MVNNILEMLDTVGSRTGSVEMKELGLRYLHGLLKEVLSQPERAVGIDPGSTPRGQIGCDQSNKRENDRCKHDCCRIMRTDLKQQAAQNSAQGKGTANSQRHSD